MPTSVTKKTRKQKALEQPTGLHRFLMAIKDMIDHGSVSANDPITNYMREHHLTHLDEQLDWPGIRIPQLVLNLDQALAHLHSIGCKTVADFIALTGADPRMAYYDRVNKSTDFTIRQLLEVDLFQSKELPHHAALTILQKYVNLHADDLTVRKHLYDFMEKRNIENWFWLQEWIRKEWKDGYKPEKPRTRKQDYPALVIYSKATTSKVGRLYLIVFGD